MNTIHKTLHSSEETEAFAKTIGGLLRGGECIELVSDLGGGKTTFVRGLAEGAGSRDIVSSPTFTIGRQYDAGKVRIYHYDFYRLPEPGLVADELQEALEYSRAVIVIEWAQSVQDVLPKARVRVELLKRADNPDYRQCEVRFPDTMKYLFKDAT